MNYRYQLPLSIIASVMLLNGCGSNTSSVRSAGDSIVDENTTENVDSNISDTTDTNTTDPEDSNTTDSNIALAPKDEPYYKYLWHVDANTTDIEGIEINPNADINITEAWTISRGRSVKIAVIDDAFDVEHEDLKDNIFATYNVDDDSDDVSNKTPLEGETNGGSHGNTCAGFIAAPINGKGIIGTAPESKLILIKHTGNSDAATIKAFEFAKNQGAKVISCSWGTEHVSQAVESELKALYDANITILFASGNDGKTLDNEDDDINDESESQWVIGVGASGENNDVTSYSNYGKNIDILAPGGDTQEAVGVLGIDDTGDRGSSNQKDLVTDAYAFTDGTSFATPVAAGVVGLMYGVNPNITPKQVRDILIDYSEQIGGDDAYYEDGFDEKRAYGKVNASRAVFEAKKLLD